MELGQLLISEGLATREQITAAREAHSGSRIDQALIRMGVVTEDRLLQTLSSEFGMPYVDLKNVQVDTDLLAKFPTSSIYRHSLLPLYRQNGHVVVVGYMSFWVSVVTRSMSWFVARRTRALSCWRRSTRTLANWPRGLRRHP